jgi:hypothetical protein
MRGKAGEERKGVVQNNSLHNLPSKSNTILPVIATKDKQFVFIYRSHMKGPRARWSLGAILGAHYCGPPTVTYRQKNNSKNSRQHGEKLLRRAMNKASSNMKHILQYQLVASIISKLYFFRETREHSP